MVGMKRRASSLTSKPRFLMPIVTLRPIIGRPNLVPKLVNSSFMVASRKECLHSVGNQNAGGSMVFEYPVQPAEFTTLSSGGPDHDFLVDSIVFQGGRSWLLDSKEYRIIFVISSPRGRHERQTDLNETVTLSSSCSGQGAPCFVHAGYRLSANRF